MPIGLGTYAYYWRRSERMPNPMSLQDMLTETATLGATVFQICDFVPIESWGAPALRDLAALAGDLGLTLELGTRGIRMAHLRRYLALAETLGVSMIRTMQNTGSDHPGPQEFDAEVRPLLPELASRGVVLGLETYEQVRTETLVAEVKRLDSASVGICLDVANVVAGLETQESCIELAAPHVVNLHVKDFEFVRSPDLIGFQLTGAPLGDGQLLGELLFDRVRPVERRISMIVEHWLPWQRDPETTRAMEAAWTKASLDYLYSL